MHEIARHRIILLDANDESRAVVARRLNAQGYALETFADAARGADAALSAPPAALVADLWMPDISGVQLCRLLRAEPATKHLPIILRGQNDDPRSRFWAEHAGATAYVLKGRVGDLVRTLASAAANAVEEDGFFMQLSGGSSDVHQRIARHLDLALFDSVIAAEVRSLGSCGSFEKLFDHFSQFLSRVVSYRWMAIVTDEPRQFGLHHHPGDAGDVEAEVRAALKLTGEYSAFSIEDDDARIEGTKAEPSSYSIPFGPGVIGRLVVAVNPSDEEGPGIVRLAARELGGPLRMAALMDESRRLAATDPLTGMHNRRALLEALRTEMALSHRYGASLSFCLMDVDHFKSINDVHGHAAGDQVLAAIGALLKRELRVPDVPARWGGEEFVVLLRQTDLGGARVVAERIRAAVEALSLSAPNGKPIPVTVSIGVTAYGAGDSEEAFIDRADRAMYRAKNDGRNRVEAAAPAEKNRVTAA